MKAMDNQESHPDFPGNLSVEITGLPALSEVEYYLLAELISMKNRKLAQAIELDIFDNCPQARTNRLELYLKAIAESEDEQHFARLAEAIASTCKHPFVQDKID